MQKRTQIISITVTLIIIAILVLTRINTSGDGQEASIIKAATRTVRLASVSDLSSDQSPLPLLGTIRSASEATLRAETAGSITKVNYTIGNFVPTNAIIAEIENSAQLAALIQAQGGLEAAQASHSKITTGVRDEQLTILETQKNAADLALIQNRSALINSLQEAFSTANDILRNKVSAMFQENHRNRLDARIAAGTANSQLVIDIENQKLILDESLDSWQNEIQNLENASNLATRTETAKNRLADINDFLLVLAQAINSLNAHNQLSQATIDSWKSNLSLSRAAATAGQSALIQNISAFISATAQSEVAQQQLEQGLAGGDVDDIRVANATLKQAQGAFAAANAAYEKTIIRTPLSGTLSTLNIKVGDFVSPLEAVALVASPGALEVVTSITEADLSSIQIGSQATINDSILGTVTSIARALDQNTKKIEVKISIPGNVASQSKLVSGQSVNVALSRSQSSQDIDTIIIPISAIKITTDGPVVFTVNAENRAVAVAIVEGAIIGDQIIVTQGLTLDMRIVLDARGLQNGDPVQIETHN